MKKLHEFDRFKKLFLEDDEIMMFSYLKRPVISLQDSSPKGEEANKSGLRSHKFQESRIIEDNEPESAGNLKMQVEQKSEGNLDSPTRSSKKFSKNSDQNNPWDKFAGSLIAYSRLLKRVKHSQTSRKILKFMDPQISDKFFDSVIEPKFMDRLKMGGAGIERNKSASAKRQRGRRLSKVEAGLMIATKLRILFLRRKRHKLKEIVGLDEENPNGVNEDHSIILEKPRIKHTRKNQLKDLYRFEDQPDITSIAIELKESSPLDNNLVNPRQNQHVDNEIPMLISKMRLVKADLPLNTELLKT